jgi:hypothetical protein
VIPPDVGVVTRSSTLPIPDSETHTLTIANTGGSDLDFVAGTVLTASSVPIYEEAVLGKDDTDPRPGLLGNGGPDMFGYTWRDSDDPGGPMFDWVDLTTIGTPISLTGDDANQAGVLIGFPFPFYGNMFSTVNVCTNGWLSFTNTTSDLANDPLPNASAPENLLAVFWDDLNPGATQRLYTYQDGTRFILQYHQVPRFSSGGPYTFQVILYPSGRIVCQYLDMQGTRLNEADRHAERGAERRAHRRSQRELRAQQHGGRVPHHSRLDDRVAVFGHDPGDGQPGSPGHAQLAGSLRRHLQRFGADREQRPGRRHRPRPGDVDHVRHARHRGNAREPRFRHVVPANRATWHCRCDEAPAFSP